MEAPSKQAHLKEDISAEGPGLGGSGGTPDRPKQVGGVAPHLFGGLGAGGATETPKIYYFVLRAPARRWIQRQMQLLAPGVHTSIATK